MRSSTNNRQSTSRGALALLVLTIVACGGSSSDEDSAGSAPPPVLPNKHAKQPTIPRHATRQAANVTRLHSTGRRLGRTTTRPVKNAATATSPTSGRALRTERIASNFAVTTFSRRRRAKVAARTKTGCTHRDPRSAVLIRTMPPIKNVGSRRRMLTAGTMTRTTKRSRAPQIIQSAIATCRAAGPLPDQM